MHLVAICTLMCIAIKRTAISNWHLESHINLHKWSLLSAPRCVDCIWHFVCIPWEGCCIEPFLAKTRRIFIAPSLDILSCWPTGEQKSMVWAVYTTFIFSGQKWRFQGHCDDQPHQWYNFKNIGAKWKMNIGVVMILVAVPQSPILQRSNLADFLIF